MAVGKRAKKAWQAAGLERITLHEGRHTFASLLIDSGANPKAVLEFMGHSKIQTTFDVYGHLFPGSHDEVRAKIEPPHTWRGGSGYREERYVSVGGRSAFARRREPR